MPLFVHTLMLAGLALAAVPVIIHLFFRMRRRRVVFPPLQFLRRTQTVQSAKLKLRDLILLICRVLAIACLALAFARPYFLGQELEAGVESGAVDLMILIDNSASMSYKPDQVSRLDLAREQADRLIAQRQPGDRIGVLEVTRPNDPLQRLDGTPARASAAVRALPQRYVPDRPIAALVSACNSFADDPEFKRTHRIIYIGDLQAAHLPTAELQRQVAPLIDRYRVEVKLIDLSATTPSSSELLAPGEAPRAANPPSANTCITAVDFNLTGFAPQQPAPVTVTVHRIDDKPVAVLPVQLTTLDSAGSAPFLGSLTMGGSGDARVTLTPTFARAGWQAVRVEIQARDPLPADNIAYAVAPLTERPAVLVVEGAADDPEVREDETKGQSYFVAQALRAQLNPAARDLDVKVVAPSGLTNLTLASHNGVVLCGVSSLSPQQLTALEQFTARGGQLLIFAARVRPGTPGKLAPPEDRTAIAFFNSAFYKNGQGLVGLRLERADTGAELTIASLHHWEQDCDIFEPFAADAIGDPTAFSLYGRLVVNSEDLQSLTARGAGRTPNGSAPPSGPPAPDPGDAGARVLAAITPGEPFLLDRHFGRGRVLTIFGAARPEWTNWIRKRGFLPVIRQWAHRLQTPAKPGQTVDAAPGLALLTHFDAGQQPTVGQVIGAPLTSAPGNGSASSGGGRYFLQRPDPAQPFQPAESARPAAQIENLTLESTLDLDTPGLYFLGADSPAAAAATGTPGAGGDAAKDAESGQPLRLPIAVSIDPSEGVLQPAAPDALLTAMAASTSAHPEHHTLTAESSDAARLSSRWWIWLAGAVAILLLLEQLLRDGRNWRAAAIAPATAQPTAPPPPPPTV